MDQEDPHSCNQMDQLDLMRDQSRKFFKQRLLFWTVRWTIGFFIIWVILQFYPDLTWLWWAGLIIALLSLAVILGSFMFLEKKMKSTADAAKDLKDELK